MTPTTSEKREAIRLAVVKKIPEVLELKFGCRVRIQFYGSPVITHRHRIGNVKECWGVTTGSYGTLINDEDIVEVIGRPLTLEDVLQIINKPVKYHTSIPTIHMDVCKVLSIWFLGKTLDQQSDETIAFIYSLIETKEV